MSDQPEITAAADAETADVEAAAPEPQADAAAPEDSVEYWRAEAEKWKALSRRNEKRARSAAKEGADVDQIRAQVRDEIQAEMVRTRALDRLEAEAERAGLSLDEVLKFTDVEKFIDGSEVRKDLIKEFVGRLAPKGPRFKQNVGVGPQAGGATAITRDDLKRMTPEQIQAAYKEGRLDHILGRK